MIGTNIGGWMVLEPWITPSLFYRWLGHTKSEGFAHDSYTLCEELGPIEGNEVMRAHWDAWLTEDHVRALAERQVEIVRLPIGDWTTTAYGPYIGCMDGAADKIQWFLDLCVKYNIKVLFDVHSLKDSQNGYDNSGKASNFQWVDEDHFAHWSVQNAAWMGHWNGTEYDVINWENIDWAVENVRNLMARWGTHPAVYAVQPVNEPWEHTDIPTLKDFYRTTREVIRDANPELVFVFHDSFYTSAEVWNDLFPDNDCENVALDTHIYMAWETRKEEIGLFCDRIEYMLFNEDVKAIKYDLWVGEWSLATDVCGMWLDGMQDEQEYFP